MPPKPTVLTDEIRAAIVEAHQPFKDAPDNQLKDIHRKIAQQLHLRRAMVAQVVRELRPRPDPLSLLTEAQKVEIVSRYQRYVEAMERPPVGRRRTIAKEMGLTLPQVIYTLRAWSRTVPNVADLSREQLFLIEKSFWQRLQRGQKVEEIIPSIVAETGFTQWQVSRWIDMLHSDTRFTHVPDLAPGQCEAIEQAYMRYLEGDGPPEKPLHQTIAEQIGVTPKEVHKVLLNFRHRALKAQG